MRERMQNEVQKVNEYYYDFLREGLPPGPLREEAFNPHPSPNPCKYLAGFQNIFSACKPKIQAGWGSVNRSPERSPLLTLLFLAI